jgi:hypothetical protein
MPRKKFDPSDPDLIEQICADIRSMTPEEALAFLTYRTPGVPETDMTGMFSQTTAQPEPRKERDPVPA